MKTMNKKNLLGAGMAIAMAFAALLPGTANAQDATPPMKPMKGGEHMMMLNREVKTTQDVKALKDDDSMAMVCAKCKTVYVTRVKQGTKGAELLMANGKTTELIGTHACPGCGGTWTIVGVGKDAKSVLKHSCSMCGDDSAFCCATSKGGKPTNGMEEEKK
jgi:hypothetical protein